MGVLISDSSMAGTSSRKRVYAPRKFVGGKRRVPYSKRKLSKKQVTYGREVIPWGVGMAQSTSGFPETLQSKVIYCSNFDSGTLTNTTPVYQVMRMNSTYDPDFSGGGHQPMYRDTYAAVYNSYRVVGSKITVDFSPSRWDYSGTFGPFIFGIAGNVSSSALSSNISTFQEYPECVWKTSRGLDATTTMTYTYSPEYRLSRPRGDDSIGAQVGTNPAQEYFAHIMMCMISSAATPATTAEISVVCKIEYAVEWFNLITPTGS